MFPNPRSLQLRLGECRAYPTPTVSLTAKEFNLSPKRLASAGRAGKGGRLKCPTGVSTGTCGDLPLRGLRDPRPLWMSPLQAVLPTPLEARLYARLGATTKERKQLSVPAPALGLASRWRELRGLRVAILRASPGRALQGQLPPARDSAPLKHVTHSAGTQEEPRPPAQPFRRCKALA